MGFVTVNSHMATEEKPISDDRMLVGFFFTFGFCFPKYDVVLVFEFEFFLKYVSLRCLCLHIR